MTKGLQDMQWCTSAAAHLWEASCILAPDTHGLRSMLILLVGPQAACICLHLLSGVHTQRFVDDVLFMIYVPTQGTQPSCQACAGAVKKRAAGWGCPGQALPEGRAAHVCQRLASLVPVACGNHGGRALLCLAYLGPSRQPCASCSQSHSVLGPLALCTLLCLPDSA